MVKVYPTDKDGNRIGPDVLRETLLWETMLKIKNLRWKLSEDQLRSKSKDAIQAESEITDNPSTEFKANEAIKNINRLDNIEVIQEYVKGDDRKSVINAADRRINKIEKT